MPTLPTVAPATVRFLMIVLLVWTDVLSGRMYRGHFPVFISTSSPHRCQNGSRLMVLVVAGNSVLQ